MKKVKKQQPQKKSGQSMTAVQYAELANYFNRGSTFLAEGKLDEAQANYLFALGLKPDFAEAHNNLGIVLQQQGKLDVAIKSYKKALSINPNYVDAHNNLGLAFRAEGNFSAAIESYQRTLALKPNYANAHCNLGGLLRAQGKLEAALVCYQRAFALQPADVEVIDMLFYAQLSCCDWSTYASSCEKIISGVKSGERGYNPFTFLAISASAGLQKQCATSFASKYPLSKTPLWAGDCYQHDKIRIAYISEDFREHPVSYLMAGLFERHDEKKFEIIAISLQPEDKTPIGQRVKAAFNRFIDVTRNSDYEIALLMRELEIDIAVDLKGFTGKRMTAIFAYRPAPVQINYLGFPGTMGAEYIDYIFADSYLIPVECQAHYSEQIVYLPDSFQANDDKKIISPKKLTRLEVGLPESGFVFCTFNNSYKTNPVFFDVWMRLLKKVPDSVLWLVADSTLVENNLCNEAIKRGISPERLVFASRLKYADHLARMVHADLFLDSMPFNAGTTASDALWAGVPIITCSGEAFAARMAGSLLNAVGLPELITHNTGEYEALAFKLATTPALLTEIRTKLAGNRNTYPLFDTKRFCHHIEAAYMTMWERHQRGEPPTGFTVPSLLTV